jgi:hypothetical protein
VKRVTRGLAAPAGAGAWWCTAQFCTLLFGRLQQAIPLAAGVAVAANASAVPHALLPQQRLHQRRRQHCSRASLAARWSLQQRALPVLQRAQLLRHARPRKAVRNGGKN